MVVLSFASLGLGLHVTWLGRQISKERARPSAKFLSHMLPTPSALLGRAFEINGVNVVCERVGVERVGN